MDGDFVLSVVLFGLFFFGLFYCYYGAQVRIKRQEIARGDAERALLQFHQRRVIFFGGQELNTVSRQAELRELPPDYNKVGGMPPPYDLVVAGNPPAYDDAIQMEAHSCNLSQLSSLPSPLETSTPTDLACVVVVPTSSQHTLPTPIHTSAAASAACRSPPPQQL